MYCNVITEGRIDSPERRVDEAYTGKLYIIAVGNVHQARAQLIHIRAFRNNGAAQPERFPIA